ncbi:lipopolysaccharide biosynthesis protein [Seohaeicola saemankumensis]|uniref:Lipopolysaccharide biosynthesis protein n=1 Tax=Seohaeicola saemankumensis TaxID=481181 RepID=A0ABW3THM7_9RHOB
MATGSQAISSIANFLFVLSLLANLTPAAFGLYSIAFAVVLAGTAILQGFFQLQMVTNLPHLAEGRRHEFVSALFLAQLIAMLVVTIATIGFAGALPGKTDYLQLATASALAILGLSGKEFLIRYLFAASQISLWIAALNILAAATLAVLAMSGLPSRGPQHAMLGYALAQIAAMLLGLFVTRVCLRPKGCWDLLRAIATNGAWGAFSAVTYSLRSSAHTFIAGATLSLVDVGQMNAARTLLTPATLMIPTLSAVMLPRLSQVMAFGSRQGLGRLALRIVVALSIMVVVYAGLLALAWPLLVKYLLGSGFIGLGPYVALWSAFALSIAVRNVAEWTLQAMQLFQSLSLYNLLAAAVTLSAVTIMTLAWGVTGAISGLIIGELFMIVLCTCFVFKRLAEQPDI